MLIVTVFFNYWRRFFESKRSVSIAGVQLQPHKVSNTLSTPSAVHVLSRGRRGMRSYPCSPTQYKRPRVGNMGFSFTS